jgi:hypothetical protein
VDQSLYQARACGLNTSNFVELCCINRLWVLYLSKATGFGEVGGFG